MDTNLSRRRMLALAVAAASMPVVAACGGDTRQQKQAAAPVKTGIQTIDPNRPGNDTWPFAEAEALNNSLTWPKTNVADPAAKVVITIASTSDVIAEVRNMQFDHFFKKRHPNIEIKRETSTFDGFLTKYMAQAAGGKLPDIMYNHYSWTQNFISNDIVAPLDDYIARSPGFARDDLPKAGLAYFERGGKLYGLPTDMAPKLLFYNKDLFDKAGLDYPDETWTIEKMIETAKKLKSGSGASKIYGFSPTPQPAPDLSTVFLMPYGGRFLSADETQVQINSPEAVKTMSMWLDLLLKDGVTPSLAELQLLEKVDPWKSGHAALHINGAWIMTELAKQKAFKWGATHVPKGPNGRHTPAVGSALVITQGSQQKEAAWLYIYEYLSSSGYRFRRISAPARQSAWIPNAEALGIPKDVAELVKEILADYATSDGVMRLPATKKAVDTAKPIWERAMLGKIDAKAALDEIAAKVGPLLAENKIA
ncbi:ABC transporter substrate-binding protein [Nonomuraea typhae]|uniref:ABC transporter substrate-binding protein n=1 Tax=Nonomuraea typhae TaxID=2603600 RepID=UPI0012FBF992|nr:sugar ABC transporter substrate-binding protein [Nonomuraea typhae]